MIAQALRKEIEKYSKRARRTNHLLRQARRAEVAPSTIQTYLSNVMHLVQHTPLHLERARELAEKRGCTDLARHYEHKLLEEKGHDAWAARDIASLPVDDEPRSHCPSPSLQALIEYLGRRIDEDPHYYLAYILVAEYATVLLGPELLSHLEERCGIKRSSMSVIENHIELDKDHVEDGLEQIDALVDDPRYLAPMRETLLTSIDHFERFCREITATEMSRAS